MNNSWKKIAWMIRNYGSSGLCFAVIIGVANLSVNFIRAPCICWIFTRFGGRSVDFSTRLGGRCAEFPPGMVGGVWIFPPRLAAKHKFSIHADEKRKYFSQTSPSDSPAGMLFNVLFKDHYECWKLLFACVKLLSVCIQKVELTL